MDFLQSDDEDAGVHGGTTQDASQQAIVAPKPVAARQDKPCIVCTRNLTPSPSGICGECCREGKQLLAKQKAKRRMARRRKGKPPLGQAGDPCDPPPPSLKTPAWKPPARTPAGSPDISGQILRHKGLVYMVLKELRQRRNDVRAFFAPHNPDQDELIQAGLEALADTIRYYNPTKGAFSTLAVKAIKQRMMNEVRRRKTTAQEFRDGRPKSELQSELEDQAGAGWSAWPNWTPVTWSKNEPQVARAAAEEVGRMRCGESAEDSAHWQGELAEASHHAASDDEVLWKKDVRDPEDYREKRDQEREEWDERRGRLLDRIGGLLPQLPELERRAVELHHGLAGGEGRSVDEITKELGLTRDRVRQFLETATEKLGTLAGSNRE